jgi:stage II sporulation protein AA (anti-sigma F factor antagonist)
MDRIGSWDIRWRWFSVDGLQIEAAQVNGTAELVVAGEIDLATAPQLRAALARLHGRVTVDLSRVTYLDSSGIGVLAGQHNRLTEQGGDVLLRGARDAVLRVLELTGLKDWVIDDG